ncbi:MAG: amidohydrolase family protein [Atopobiaceae bacterium]|nr:amidohydrolase family protein [Atopobiaceae bacterium]
MINTFCKKPLWGCNSTLVRVAQGLAPADLVVRDARLVSVTTHEVLEHADIAVAEGRIAYLGLDGHTAEHCTGPDTHVIDAAGAYVAPGFLDGHMHVESAMVGVSEYARAAIPHGTVGIYMDPHEMANVCGLDGVRTMLEEAAESPIKAMLTTPSCVPAVPGFEDTGASVDADDVEATMSWPETVGLGEMMNFPGILAADADALAEVDATLRADKCVTGHYSTPRPTAASTPTWPRASRPATRASAPKKSSPSCAWACTPSCARALPGTTSPRSPPPSPRTTSTRASAASSPTTTIPTPS